MNDNKRKEVKPRGYWTKERVLEEAKKYKTQKELKKNSGGVYKAAWKNGWFKDMDLLVKVKSPKGYWTKERVFEEGRKYRTKNEFKKGCGVAYDVARSNGWFDEMDWLVEVKKPNGYWTKERVFEEARKYTRSADFKKTCPTGYYYAVSNGWLKDMDWLCRGRKSNEYWTKERVFEEARKYTSSSELYYNNQSVYRKALKKGWLDEMDWIDHHNWTKEEVFEEARKYTLKKDFRKNSARIYEFAKKNGWLKEMDWIKSAPNPYKDPMYAVYCYRFNEYNTIYVGLSMRPKERAKQHRREKASKVYQFAHEHGIEVPEMEILIDGLYQEGAQLYEDKFKKVSEYTGFNVISVGATGVGTGSLGGVAKALSKAKVFEEAIKYTTKKDFREKCHKAYMAAWKNGWLDEMDWLESHSSSLKKRVFEESRKYTTKKDFRKNNKKLYQTAKKNGWFDNMEWLVNMDSREIKSKLPKRKCWTKDEVFAEARKYTTKKDFRDNYRVAYDVARSNGWFDEMDWLARKHKWTKTAVFEEAIKYTTKKDFMENCKKAYNAARKNGWLNEMDWLSGKQNTVIKSLSEKPHAKRKCWTKDEVFAEARKYNTRKEFSNGSPEARYIAKINGWLKEMTWLVKKQTA